VASEFRYVCLNEHTPTFVLADPPVSLARDKERFHCAFKVDGHRRLLVERAGQRPARLHHG